MTPPPGFPKDGYFAKLQDNSTSHEDFLRAQKLFEKSASRETLAKWFALARIMDGSGEFGVEYNKLIDELNDHGEQVVDDLKSAVGQLSRDEDGHLRAMFSNLVFALKVSPDEKVSYLGTELVRPLKLDDTGQLSDNSAQITISLALMKNITQDGQKILEYAKQSLAANPDAKIKEEIRQRVLTYFPELEGKL